MDSSKHSRPYRHIALSMLALSFLTGTTAAAASYQSMTWSKTYYGPDGPWQAVSVEVGGWQNDSSDITNYQQPVDLFPGGSWGVGLIGASACTPYASQGPYCGAGGVFQPSGSAISSTVFDSGDYGIDYTTSYNVWFQAMTAGAIGTGAAVTVYNVSLNVYNTAAIEYPNGFKTGPQCGSFPLNVGSDTATQQSFSLTATTSLNGWIYPANLYATGITSSYSYGLHYGSAAFNYVGSLLLGGYDKSRIIGPTTTYGLEGVELVDITIGVETGGSPFNFTSKDSLLITNSSTAGPITVNPDPYVPYLQLPSQTCQMLAQVLPIYFDRGSQYYLWDTTDPAYKAVVTSAAWLGFEFPPAPGDSAPVIIKVPFSLLNLTLQAPVVSTPVSYFPCQPFTPNSGDNYRLGRAFLQAAFLGQNINARTSFLAQAPGPGAARNGLGAPQGQIINNGDETLTNIFNDTTLFNQSWSGHWFPLPNNTIFVNGTSVSTQTSGTITAPGTGGTGTPKPGLSSGAIAGIAVGAVVGGLAILGAIFFFWKKNRRTGRQKTPSEEPMNYDGAVRDIKHPEHETTEHTPIHMTELPVHERMGELPGNQTVQHELYADNPVHELEA